MERVRVWRCVVAVCVSWRRSMGDDRGACSVGFVGVGWWRLEYCVGFTRQVWLGRCGRGLEGVGAGAWVMSDARWGFVGGVIHKIPE